MKRKLVFAGVATFAAAVMVILIASQRVKENFAPTGYYEAVATPDGKLTFQRGERAKMTLIADMPLRQKQRLQQTISEIETTNTVPSAPPQ